MSLAIVHSRAQDGVAAPAVSVEVHLSGGLPGTSIVGLPEAAVKESRDRVRVAIQHTHLDYPARRITVNLAPADLPKDGGRFDLPIALGILAASGHVPREALREVEFYGELALDGSLRAVTGVLPVLLAARAARHVVVVPRANATEAALVRDVDVRVADDLLQVCAFLCGNGALPRAEATPCAGVIDGESDLVDVRGQAHARRALEIAATGGHHLLFVGPPGTGKTMLASRLPGLLPPLDDVDALESCAVRSVAGQGVDVARWRTRPFRAPHHTASAVALVGGGSQPRPGEISLAHHGVLFLDELPEFDRHVLEVLREPLETGRVLISRAARQAEFPARFQLVAAMNPCPCGYAGDASARCLCTPDQVQRYRGKISGPLLDRIDLQLEVPRVPLAQLNAQAACGETSAVVRERVIAARARQVARAGKPNALLGNQEVARDCCLEPADRGLLEHAVDRLGLSARAYHRLLRVARTLADMAGDERIARGHLTEAIQYRRLESRS